MRDLEGKTFIYALVDPRDWIVFYVGKSNDPLERSKRGRYQRHNKDVDRIIKNLRLLGLDIIVSILEEVPLINKNGVSQLWVERERFWVSEMRHLGFDLLNKNPGGGGPSVGNVCVSEETRKKLSEKAKGNKSNLGRKNTEEHKRKTSEGMKGKNVGKVRTEEWKENKRREMIDYWVKVRSGEIDPPKRDPETLSKISKEYWDKVKLGEIVHHPAPNNKGRTPHNKGKKHTEETKVKMSDGQRRSWVRRRLKEKEFGK